MLDHACLDGDNTHGYTIQTSLTDNNGLGTATESLSERVLVEEAGEPLGCGLINLALDEPPRVIRTLQRHVANVAVPGV